MTVHTVTSLDSPDPASLWQALAAYEDKTGGAVLAIPHNGNLSNGTMFALADFLGNPLTRQYAETRARWEPLYEVTQIKGDGETHPFLSPNDEFANFERWDKGNLDLSARKTAGDAAIRVCAGGAEDRPEAGRPARGQSL